MTHHMHKKYETGTILESGPDGCRVPPGSRRQSRPLDGAILVNGAVWSPVRSAPHLGNVFCQRYVVLTTQVLT